MQYLMYRSIAFYFTSFVYFAKTLFLLKKKSRILSAVSSGIAYADKGSKRIKQKIAKLERNGKPANVATMAGARELSCFIWGMMTGNIA